MKTIKGPNEHGNAAKARRSFFEKLWALLITGVSANAWRDEITNDQSKERLKFLTGDGKLVEVPKSVYNRIKQKESVSHKGILNWIKKAI